MPSRVLPSPELEAFAFEKLAVSTVAVALTSATYFPQTGDTRGATGAFITVETNSIRWREDGVAAPDSTTGHLAIAGTEIVLQSSNAIKAFRAIRASADAVIQVTYYR